MDFKTVTREEFEKRVEVYRSMMFPDLEDIIGELIPPVHSFERKFIGKPEKAPGATDPNDPTELIDPMRIELAAAVIVLAEQYPKWLGERLVRG